ncbi:hypothetical protein, partial [Acidaminococcus intestini]|uniref:hypothetical protein n=1 Tax=Acidaminococcus intestini TaxID=187327 RepID=UPI003A857D48
MHLFFFGCLEDALIVFWKNTKNRCSISHSGFLRFYNLFWGAKVTVQMRVLSAPTFFNKKIGICTQILY